MEAMKQPGAFTDVIGIGTSGCDGIDEDSPSVIDEQSFLLSDVLMKVCEERDLPIALKVGAHRGVNPRLKQAGDGVVAFADAGMLGRLCSRFPNVRFLATFLSRANQHEACVLASKFGNLHI
jgi:predicted TIM-barrel fold metal-dependent hydrolase